MPLRSSDFRKSLSEVCESAVQLFGASHAAYLRLLPDREAGIVTAESQSDIRAIDQRIQIRGIPLEEDIFEKKRPVFIRDVREEPNLGPVGLELARLGVRSLLVIPIQGNNGSVVGSFSLDWKQICANPPVPDDPRCEVFARLVGWAISAHEFQELQERRRSLIEQLDYFASYLQDVNEIEKLFPDIVRFAVELLDASCAALYKNHGSLQILELLTEHGPFPHPGQILHSDVHIAAFAAVRRRPYSSRAGDDGHPTAFGCAAAVPIKYLGQVRYVLAVAQKDPNRPFGEAELEALERYGARAWQAIFKVQNWNRDFEWVTLLNHLSAFMQAQQESENGEMLILFALLSGVTASFGLRFNRASVLMYDERDHFLVHHFSIGQMTLAAWRAACELSRNQNLDDLQSILTAADSIIASPSELHVRMGDFRHQLSLASDSVLYQALRNGKADVVKPEQLPSDLRLEFQAVSTVAVAPLRSANKSIGLIIADNIFTGVSISNADLEALCIFGATAASSLDNLRLNLSRREVEGRLRGLLKTTRTLDPSLGLRQVLKNIVEQTRDSTHAAGASITLSADGERAWLQVPAGKEPAFPIQVVMRAHGFSSRVMASGKPIAIPDIAAHRDEMNPHTSAASYQSSICLPLNIRSRCIGVMWLLFDERRTFQQQTIEDYQAFADNVATVYDNALRRAELESLRAAAMALSQPDRLDAELQRVPVDAMRLTDADGATFWAYDFKRKQFTGRVSAGHGQNDLEPPSSHGISTGLLEKGYMYEGDLRSARLDHFHEIARNRDISAFQGVCVRVGEEPVGVLYALYRNARPFDDSDRQQLESFAALNAPLLKATRVLKQSQVFQRAAERISQQTAAGDLQETLRNIVESIRDVYACGPVLLYLLEPGTRRVIPDPTMSGVKDEEAVRGQDFGQLQEMLTELLDMEKPYVARDISKQKRAHPQAKTIFDGTLFTQREDTNSCAAFSLKVGRHELGLLFVNHVEEHEFSQEELSTLEVFAKQASLAILPDRLFQLSATALYGFAHDIEAPWTHIKRVLEFTKLRFYGEINERQSQELEQALLRVREGERAITRLHALPNIIADKMEPKWVNLRDRLFDEIATDFRSLVAPRRRFYYEPKISESLKVYTDLTMVECILLNLLNNAEKYTREGSITLILEHRGSRVLITVRDTGIGVPAGDQERIFDLGHRGANVGGTAGAGFGLFFCRECARILGGELRLNSQVNEGSEFCFSLPTGAENELSKAHFAD